MLLGPPLTGQSTSAADAHTAASRKATTFNTWAFTAQILPQLGLACWSGHTPTKRAPTPDNLESATVERALCRRGEERLTGIAFPGPGPLASAECLACPVSRRTHPLERGRTVSRVLA